MKYLDLIIDKKWNFTEHTKQVRRKAEGISLSNWQVRRMENFFIRTKIERANKPAILYASKIWGEQARKTGNRKIMMAI